ncbi:MAG TPA: hypothetical protein VGD31_05020 [Sphingobacteriaceae bacterium]
MVKRTTFSQHITALKKEVQMLLRFYLALKRIVKFDNFHEISRSYYVDLLVACKAIENDILIRITKFNDTDKGVHSFHALVNEMSLSHPNYQSIIDKVTKFATLLRPFELTRRHTELAHLKIGEQDNELMVQYDFRIMIVLIAEIVDLAAQTKLPYLWSDGRYEKFDLRKEILESEERLSRPLGDFM